MKPEKLKSKPTFKIGKDYEQAYAKISELVTKGQLEAEEECLTKVLRQFLKREPTREDFKNCIKIERVGVINSYVLAYKSTKLGLITRAFMCNSDIINKNTGQPDFHFKCSFNPEILEVPEQDYKIIH